MDNKKIVWLASYPKSGNTWFRAFLTSLFDARLDINQLQTDGVFYSRAAFDNITDLDSTYLYDEEAKVILPEVFTYLPDLYEKRHIFIKTHDAYILNKDGCPIVPSEPTLKALYFIRNPLDIVGSFAHHNNETIDETIKLINDPNGSLAKQSGNLNLNNQFTQLMLSWSGHVKSWTTEMPFPVLVIRYEDMLNSTLTTFTKALSFIGIDFDKQQIEEGIKASQFRNLKMQEKKAGFIEKNKNSKSFFRKGTSGNWINELTNEQIERIVVNHKMVMERYNYL